MRSLIDTLEVIIGSNDGNLYCLDHYGFIEWSYHTSGEIYSSAAIVDLNNDNIKEILFGSKDNKFYCLSVTGVINSGVDQWYAFRGGRFHTGWIDSDSDYIDDLTECCYYKTDPYTPNPNFFPPTNGSPSFTLSNINYAFLIIPILIIIHYKRKRKIRL